eukprot:scaffold763_cov402-Prasinococcus_capsulatus_cf.AAC.6
MNTAALDVRPRPSQRGRGTERKGGRGTATWIVGDSHAPPPAPWPGRDCRTRPSARSARRPRDAPHAAEAQARGLRGGRAAALPSSQPGRARDTRTRAATAGSHPFHHHIQPPIHPSIRHDRLSFRPQAASLTYLL